MHAVVLDRTRRGGVTCMALLLLLGRILRRADCVAVPVRPLLPVVATWFEAAAALQVGPSVIRSRSRRAGESDD